jgi:uncharacterized protein (TIGR03437 family)
VGLAGTVMIVLPAFGQKPLAYTSVSFPALGTAPLAAVADFNGDGKLDIVSGSPLQLLLGKGDGTFRSGPVLPLALAASGVAAGDLNGDGKPDLVVCSLSQLVVLIDEGGGMFRVGQTLQGCNGSGSFLLADLKGDGKPDLYDSGMYIRFGNGDGTFSAPTVYNPPLPFQPLIADFNGDGLPDLASLTGLDTTHTAGLWLNQGGGRFNMNPETVVSFTTAYGSTNPDSLAAGDFNGDGKPDLALLTPTGELRVFQNNGDGTFRMGATYSFAPGSIGLYAQDLDRDGKLDLLVTTTQISILRGRGDGTFAPHIDLCSQGPLGSPFDLFGNSGALAFGDFNGDGVLDMIDYSAGLPTSNRTAALLLSGAKTLPVIHPGSPRNGATFLSGPVAAGGLVTIFGDNLGEAACQGLGEQILFNGIPATLLYASPTQIDAQVPWEIAGATKAEVTALNNGGGSAAVTVAVAASSPGIFTESETGSGQGTIVAGATHHFATPDNPAQRGGYASIYGAGFGPVTNQPPTGSVSPATPLAQTKSLPVVTVGGIDAQVTFSGLAPGLLALYQINFIVPDAAPVGSAIPVLVTVDGAPSNTVTIAIQ